IRRSISLTEPGIHSAYPRRCIAPGRVHSRCEQSGEPLNLEIGLEGPPPYSWFFHCPVPAAKWWDDIVTTCFSSGRKNGFGSGASRMVIPCGRSSRWNQLWTLATTWYSTRLQENSRRPQPDEMRSIFARLGLGGDFWDPQSDSFS